VPAESLARLIALIKGGAVSHAAAKKVFTEIAAHGGEPRTVAEALGLVQVSDAGAVTGWVDEVIAGNAAEAARYRGGETKLLQFFVGQVMKTSRGKADPQLVRKVLEERLAAS
jgi:Asp-tRNA(Asn)/Glu-tRNA(Gln) amidotransferase B subunit